MSTTNGREVAAVQQRVFQHGLQHGEVGLHQLEGGKGGGKEAGVVVVAGSGGVGVGCCNINLEWQEWEGWQQLVFKHRSSGRITPNPHHPSPPPPQTPNLLPPPSPPHCTHTNTHQKKNSPPTPTSGSVLMAPSPSHMAATRPLSS